MSLIKISTSQITPTRIKRTQEIPSAPEIFLNLHQTEKYLQYFNWIFFSQKNPISSFRCLGSILIILCSIEINACNYSAQTRKNSHHEIFFLPRRFRFSNQNLENLGNLENYANISQRFTEKKENEKKMENRILQLFWPKQLIKDIRYLERFPSSNLKKLSKNAKKNPPKYTKYTQN